MLRGHVRGGRLGALGLVVVLVALVGAACVPQSPPEAPPPTPVVPFTVLGGVEQVYVMGATPGAEVTIRGAEGVVARGTADRFGSFVQRELQQGATYTVEHEGSQHTVRVLRADEHPDRSFYEATRMTEGMNYVPMRDGITLNATVRPPIGQTLSDGPFPTVIEYSGYQIAAPSDPLGAKIANLLGLPADPLAPGSETDFGGLLLRLGGYAVVSVQMRGTGCSGGEADLFDLPSQLDGYDIVETVAAQDWVAGGRVGMVGISFSGFSQIATARTQPPNLAAIVPLSFVGSLYDIAHPGGIFNNGFARTWMAERVASTRPAPDPGALPYANHLVHTDPQCRHNQLLRLQTRDGNAMIRDEDLNVGIYPRRDFSRWMGEIDVPTFASLQFEDDETSSYAILDAQRLLDSNELVWLNVSSGHHRDAVTPETITALFEFLDIYVAQRTPQIKLLVHLLSDVIFGDGSVDPPLTELWYLPYDEARRSFESRDRVRVLLELHRGANSGTNTGTRWKFGASQFPVEGSDERTWYLNRDGSLTTAAPSVGTASYRPDPGVRPETLQVGDGTTLEWTTVPDGAGLGFVTEPLEHDVVALGPAAARVWLSSSATDTDVGLTLSEVRPDGTEMLVSTGTQRASKRGEDHDASTATRPALTFTDREPLNGLDEVPVQILPVGHVFRAGSRIRLGIQAVGGDMERWAYDSVDPVGGATLNTVHHGPATPSSITLTVAPMTGYPSALLPCPSAGKPCRVWMP